MLLDLHSSLSPPPAAASRGRRQPTRCVQCGGKSWNGHTCRSCRRALPASGPDGRALSRNDVRRDSECRRGLAALDDYLRVQGYGRLSVQDEIVLAVGGEIERSEWDGRLLALQRWAWTGDSALAAIYGLV